MQDGPLGMGLDQLLPPKTEQGALPPPPRVSYHETTITIGVLSVGKPHEVDSAFMDHMVEGIRDHGMPSGGTAFYEDTTKEISRAAMLEVLGDEDYLQLLEDRAMEAGDVHAEDLPVAEPAAEVNTILPPPAPAPELGGTVFAVLQEGGTSSEIYLLSSRTEAEAQQVRIACANDSYRTSPPVSIPADLAAHPAFSAVVAQMLAASREFAYVEVPEDYEPPTD
jgi:hypothetical protein